MKQPVMDSETLEQWESVTACAIALGCAPEQVRKHLRGFYRTVKGRKLMRLPRPSKPVMAEPATEHLPAPPPDQPGTVPLETLVCITPEHWRDANRWVTYSHSLPDGDGPVWIGYCRATEVLLSPDAYNSPLWREQVLPAPKVMLTLHSTHKDDLRALQAAMALIRQHRPPANAGGGPVGSGRGGRRVLCIETGEVFESAKACADRFGIHASQLSVYLSRRTPGLLRGYSFRRC